MPEEVIIHGASSFIGKNLVKALIDANHPFCIIARDSSDLSFCEKTHSDKIIRYSKSIEDVQLPAGLSKRVFIELSWWGVYGSERNDQGQLTINIPLMINSVQAARRFQCSHWIGFGSQAEYGNLNKRITENDLQSPTTLYGKSKLICSEITKELCTANNIHYSWLRLFSVFGPDDNHEWFIQYLIKEMLSDREINATKAEQIWDYLYIDDIVTMLFKLIKSNGCGIANLGSGKGTPLKSIIELVRKQTKSKSVINYGAIEYRPDQVMFMEADITRLSTFLDWQPVISVEEGLLRTVNYYKDKLTFINE